MGLLRLPGLFGGADETEETQIRPQRVADTSSASKSRPAQRSGGSRHGAKRRASRRAEKQARKANRR